MFAVVIGANYYHYFPLIATTINTILSNILIRKWQLDSERKVYEPLVGEILIESLGRGAEQEAPRKMVALFDIFFRQRATRTNTIIIKMKPPRMLKKMIISGE